jgi:hypothetical protein
MQKRNAPLLRGDAALGDRAGSNEPGPLRTAWNTSRFDELVRDIDTPALSSRQRAHGSNFCRRVDDAQRIERGRA